MKDPYYLDLARHRFGHKRFEYSVNAAQKHASEGIPYWEHVVGFRTTLQSGLVIYPSENMIENVGTSSNATHAPDNIAELPRDIQSMFMTRASDISFPLKHPPYVIEDYHYFDNIMRHIHPNIFRKISRKFEHAYRKSILKIRRKSK